VGSPSASDVVVVDHYDSYTWNLVHLIAGVTGRAPTVVQHDQTGAEFLERFDHVVLSPGPGRPDDPRDFSVGNDILREGTRPVLGVCLGMQGLVTAYGGTVTRELPAHGEVAVINHDGRGVYLGIPQDFRAVRYHSLQAVSLPDCLEATAACGGQNVTDPWALMGVRHRTKPLEGVQFHPESILSEHGDALIRNFLR
jgi:anthranilate synthase component II